MTKEQIIEMLTDICSGKYTKEESSELLDTLETEDIKDLWECFHSITDDNGKRFVEVQ